MLTAAAAANVRLPIASKNFLNGELNPIDAVVSCCISCHMLQYDSTLGDKCPKDITFNLKPLEPLYNDIVCHYFLPVTDCLR